MTVINRIIKQAKRDPMTGLKPSEVTVNYNEIGVLSQHIKTMTYSIEGATLGEIEAMLLNGTVKILGVPIRIVGAPRV